MLLLCSVGFAVVAGRIDFSLLSNVLSAVSFVLFSVLGLITLIRIGLDMYKKANNGKSNGSAWIAVIVAVYVVLIVFQPFSREQADVQEAGIVYTDGYEDGLGDGYDTGYDDGYSDAYAYGYADGHSEAEGHSETYDELLRQAYQTTGGAGAGFSRDDDGNIYVEETAPNGQKVKVPFTP